MSKILIADDDQTICNLLARCIQLLGHDAITAHTLDESLKAVNSYNFDLVLLDIVFPEGNSLDILPAVLDAPSKPEVIIITGSGNINNAEIAFKSGAWDYIQKPFTKHDVSLPVTRALQYRQEKKIANTPIILKQNGIIGASTKINQCLNSITRASATMASVLINGETGTGKELFARAIHRNSKRASANFCIIDSAALPETLAEGILFGHEKGAFTGADRRKEGLIVQADGGTLFLDEIGDLPLNIQKSLLRCLQEKKVLPLGAKKEIDVDFRLVAATNRDLKKLVQKGLFREDLLYRISAIEVNLPPLRERGDDIQEIALEKINRLSMKYGIGTKSVSQDLINVLKVQKWHGNVRELINVIEYVLASAGEDPTLFPKHLPPEYRTAGLINRVPRQAEAVRSELRKKSSRGNISTLSEYRENAEKSYLVDLLDASNGNRQKACSLSGISQSRLYGLLKKYNLSGFSSYFSKERHQ